ncbi:unnamed protein product [Pleuronectes platessa]|uniref:Uncharacterized protein n=1 Tax=Pleuronectes platessa TaxID=8262 RepID=A0A9N7VTR5_PLEPL|nr:unnamed protein product [Pleuronectes platessa]
MRSLKVAAHLPQEQQESAAETVDRCTSVNLITCTAERRTDYREAALLRAVSELWRELAESLVSIVCIPVVMSRLLKGSGQGLHLVGGETAQQGVWGCLSVVIKDYLDLCIACLVRPRPSHIERGADPLCGFVLDLFDFRPHSGVKMVVFESDHITRTIMQELGRGHSPCTHQELTDGCH